MKRILASLAVLTTLCGGVFVHNAKAGDDHGCSNATLQGSYAFHEQGTIFAQGLQAGVGVVTFDGDGNFVVSGSFVNQTTGAHRSSGGGTYAVNSDCTGSGVADNGSTFDFVIADNGDEYYQIPTTGDRVVVWVLKRQFTERHKHDQDRGSRDH